MSFCLTGLNSKLTATAVKVHVSETHPLIQIGNTLDWKDMSDLIMEDLKSSSSYLFWWLGRKIDIRTHLGIYALQCILKMTDRGMKDAIESNGVYQVFCGRTVVEKWFCPHFSTYEKFRNRLTPETQNRLVSYVVKEAEKLGFADPGKLDVDSTSQEANMAYPSDAALLTKLAKMGKKVTDYLKPRYKKLFEKIKEIDMKGIQKKAKTYFFMAQNTSREKKNESFKDLFEAVKEDMSPIIDICKSIHQHMLQDLPWNIKRTVIQVQEHAQKYLEDVLYFIKNQEMKPGKILAFYLKHVGYLKKGKIGEGKKFGRIFQLGRTGGNFLVAMTMNLPNIYQEDKTSLLPFVRQYQETFGKNILNSLGTDKGYWYKKTVDTLKEEIPEVGVQSPGNVKAKNDIDQELKNRRAGIEPLIGHAKRFGLGKSRAKSDITTLSSGYRAVLGFNLHQLMRHLTIPQKVANI